jgi:putative two-component system response regulator
MQPMSPRDWENFRKHAELGSQLLNVPSSPILRIAALIALTHHERWDGTGYPLGLAGEDIPLEGRITAVADVFDALTTQRPYKAPIPYRQAVATMEEHRGMHFDPQVLDAFARQRAEIIEIQIQCADLE